MTLILQGGGGYPETKSMDKLFFDALPTNKKILYIPIAMTDGHSMEDCQEYMSGITKDLEKSQNIDMCTDLEILPESLFETYGGIYIGGGNTFKLLYDIRKTGTDHKIRKFLNDGGVVCGGSAGAIIFGNNLNTAPDANIVHLKDIQGFDLVPGYAIVCHYKGTNDNELKIYLQHHTVNLIVLPEPAGILIDEHGIQAIGTENIIVLKTTGERKEYQPGESLFSI